MSKIIIIFLRFSFTPNGRVLPQNMAKIAFMIHWQMLRMTKRKRFTKEAWKFIDYNMITENISKLGNELGKMGKQLGKELGVLNKDEHQNRDEKEDVKKDVYLCDLLRIALSPPKKKETNSKLPATEGTNKQSLVDVREGFRKSKFENLNDYMHKKLENFCIIIAAII